MKIISKDPKVQLKADFAKIVRECINDAMTKFGVYELEDTEILFDLKGQCAGQAAHRYGEYKLRFNFEAIQKDFNDMAYDTVPHEVAHLVCFVNPRLGKNHNRGWQKVCRALGGSAERTHDMVLTRARKVKRFVYVLEDGTELKLTKGKHTKLQTNQVVGMFLPGQYCNSKKNQPIEKHQFVKMIEVQ